MNKSIKKNYIYNLLYQALIMILPLLTTPYLSRTLGAKSIGIYSFTLSILSYFVLFGCLGINLYGQREIAIVYNNVEKRSKTFFELLILKATMILLSFLIYVFLYYNNLNYGIYYKILTIELFSNIFDITWFYQGIEDFKKITIRNTIVRIISTLLIFLFVKKESDLIIYFLINCISNLFGFLCMWFNLKKYIKKIKLKNLEIKKHLIPTVSLFIPQVAIQIYTVLDKTMLGMILDDMSQVGYYEQSQKIIKMLIMLIAALGTVMGPRIAKLHANGEEKELKEKIFKVFNIVCLISFPMCFGLGALTSNFVPWFFGIEFMPLVKLLIIFSFLLIIIGLNNITGMQYLIPTRQQSKFTISVFVGAFVNFILNIVLIPTYKANGAAFASVIAELLILLIHIFYLRKTFDFKNTLKYNYKYLIISIIMAIIVSLVGKLFSPSILSTIVQAMIGIFVYLICLFIIKDNLLIYTIELVKSKLKFLKK